MIFTEPTAAACWKIPLLQTIPFEPITFSAPRPGWRLLGLLRDPVAVEKQSETIKATGHLVPAACAVS